MRNLTLLGRIQIIKTFIISQFLYVTSSISIPETYIKEINTMIWKFVWDNKTERLSRKLMVKPVEKGGLNAPDFRLMVRASKILKLDKKILEPKSSLLEIWFRVVSKRSTTVARYIKVKLQTGGKTSSSIVRFLCTKC